MPLVLRSTKGSPLTNNEVDGNFVFLGEGVDAAGQAAGSAQDAADAAAQAATAANEDLTTHKTSGDHDDRYLRKDIAQTAPLLSDIPQSGVVDLPFALDALRTATQRAIYGDGPYPSLDLQFVGAKLLDPNTSFARASTATYWDETGILRTAAVDEPVIEYDPATGECLGLRTQMQAVNLAYLSKPYNINVGGTAVKVTAVGINGVDDGSACTLTQTADSTAGYINRVYSVPAANYTASIYISKNGTSPRLRVAFTLGGTGVPSGSNAADLHVLRESGSVSVSSGSATYAVKDYGGWWRLIVNLVFPAEGVNTLQVYCEASAFRVTGQSATLDALQIEAGTVATSFIPTNGTQVTRAAEMAVTHPLSVSNFNPNEGTVFFDRGEMSDPNKSGFTFGVGSTSSLAYLGIDYFEGTTSGVFMQPFGSFIMDNTNRGMPHKYAVTWKVVSASEVQIKIVRDGALSRELVASGDTATIATWTRLSIGAPSYSTTAGHWVNTRQISLYKRALSTAELIALTS